MARRGFIHGNNAEGLEPAGAIERLHNDARTLIGRLIAIPPKAGHVQQHIGAASVRHDKAEALACVKPLDGPDDFYDVEVGGRILEILVAPFAVSIVVATTPRVWPGAGNVFRPHA